MQTKSTNKVGTAFSNGCGVIFFAVFALMGGGFMYLMGSTILKDRQTRTWTATDAVLLGQPVLLEKTSDESIPFRYTYQGNTYKCDTVTRLGSPTVNDKRSESFLRLRNLPAGSEVTCYVNPEKPAEAVLEHRSITHAWFLLVPGLFLLIGLGGIYFIIFAKPAAEKPVSERHKAADNSACGILFLRLFASIFIIAGVSTTWFIALKPWLESLDAASWPQVSCKIEIAKVTSHRGSKGGVTYGIDVLYRYEFEGRKYSSDRYNFSTGKSSSRDWREEAVRKLRSSKNPVCYVNPADPNKAVLATKIGNEIWFGLIPLIFLFSGLVLFFAAPKMIAKRANAQALPIPAPNVISLVHGSYELKPTSSPKAGCIGMGIFALFWNGVVWTIFLQPDISGPPKAFLFIFILIGVIIAVSFGYFFLIFFNPKPTVTVDATAVRLGDSIQFKWKFDGNTSRISLLEIILTAKESATYRRGTNTVTDTHFFIHKKLHETRDRAAIAAGELTITIPADSMHSFDSSNNKIIWAVTLHGDIAKWPDVDLEFPLTVYP